MLETASGVARRSPRPQRHQLLLYMRGLFLPRFGPHSPHKFALSLSLSLSLYIHIYIFSLYAGLHFSALGFSLLPTSPGRERTPCRTIKILSAQAAEKLRSYRALSCLFLTYYQSSLLSFFFFFFFSLYVRNIVFASCTCIFRFIPKFAFYRSVAFALVKLAMVFFSYALRGGSSLSLVSRFFLFRFHVNFNAPMFFHI